MEVIVGKPRLEKEYWIIDVLIDDRYYYCNLYLSKSKKGKFLLRVTDEGGLIVYEVGEKAKDKYNMLPDSYVEEINKIVNKYFENLKL